MRAGLICIRVLFGSFGPSGTWVPNGLLTMTPDEQYRHNVCVDPELMQRYRWLPSS